MGCFHYILNAPRRPFYFGCKFVQWDHLNAKMIVLKITFVYIKLHGFLGYANFTNINIHEY